MSREFVFRFWSKWIEADELEKLKLIKTLPIDEEYVTLLNSYLVDLYETIQCIGYDDEINQE